MTHSTATTPFVPAPAPAPAPETGDLLIEVVDHDERAQPVTITFRSVSVTISYQNWVCLVNRRRLHAWLRDQRGIIGIGSMSLTAVADGGVVLHLPDTVDWKLSPGDLATLRARL